MDRKTHIAVKIEANRQALLRMVALWLFCAQLVTRDKNKALPRRLSNWIAELIGKAELATEYLIEALAFRHMPRNARRRLYRAPLKSFQVSTDERLTLAIILRRLHALQSTLNNLENCAKAHALGQTTELILRDENTARSAIPAALLRTQNFSQQTNGHANLVRVPP